MMLDADFDAHYQAGRDAFRLGRGREAIATINHNSAFRLGVEDAVKQGDPSIAAALIPLLEDPEPAVAVEAAYLLGERAYAQNSAVDIEDALAQMLERSLILNSARRISGAAAGLRECVRVGGARKTVPLWLAALRWWEKSDPDASWPGVLAVEAALDLGVDDQTLIDAVVDHQRRAEVTEVIETYREYQRAVARQKRT